MRKVCRSVLACLLIAVFVWSGTVLADRQKLRQELIRIHVVANSDTPEDQSIKLTVRDAVLSSLQSDLEKISDVNMARRYLQDKLPFIQNIACRTLQALGCKDAVTVSMQKEMFGRTASALYSRPSGTYESLRITIGSGQGKNWWTVAFPDVMFLEAEDGEILSVFAKSQEDNQQKMEPRIRFWVLDALGRLENNFFGG